MLLLNIDNIIKDAWFGYTFINIEIFSLCHLDINFFHSLCVVRFGVYHILLYELRRPEDISWESLDHTPDKLCIPEKWVIYFDTAVINT